MAVVYVLAHFDDEYGAVPLIREAARAGTDQWFLYVADYRTPELAAVRLAESQRFLAHLGIEASRVVHVGKGSGAFDGDVHAALPAAYEQLRATARSLPALDRLVVTAFEGGHMDHDMCALMAWELSRELGGAPIEQFGLYNGLGLAGPLFHGAMPIPQNGPVRRVKVTFGEWLSWAASVRFYPSQAKTWVGLWPAMFWSLLRRGFGVQTLSEDRIAQRPHEGALLYERMFKRPYSEVKAAADSFLAARLALHDHQEAP
ncbi:PIG-L deacetylase family protein [Phenylobacterium deserti]|uniref:PIG-L family deacetylase n=1 Tax=Phenylobacterium deserti TaxID=1914756 RepID=A0A328AUB6_9CAUL|nr:PIG-L family deacetylase [Phenylobacterium deserti]RAK57865.1 hypothetical protein DJ018_08130 [Phenylobacterium deserti]